MIFITFNKIEVIKTCKNEDISMISSTLSSEIQMIPE